MSKTILVLAVLLLTSMTGLAADLPKRNGNTKGIKGITPRGIKALSQKNTQEHTSRNLKGKKKGKYYHYDEDDDDYAMPVYKKKGKKKGKKGKKGKGKGAYYYNDEPPTPKCQTVVEPAEFLIHNALAYQVPGDSNDSGTLGTQYIFQGPLLDEDLEELQDYYVSGMCTRTWNSTMDIPGAAFCQMTITLITGACINVAGEVFDDWTNNLAIIGGTFEMVGVSGQATLVSVDRNIDPESGDFFSSEYIHARATLLYEICPEGYWEPLIATGPDDLEGATYPDPFGLDESEDSS